MSNTDSGNKKGKGLTAMFKSISGYAGANKVQTGALLTSILLGTTALSTPLLTSAAGAGALLAGSIALLLQNGKTTIQNTLALGEKYKLSALTLGLVIGSLNTVPEVMVSLGSALRGAIDLGVGNVVGSNIAHSLLILGATAAVAGISKAKDLSWKFNTVVMAGTTALFGAQLVAGQFSPVMGGAMLGLGGFYLLHRLFAGQKKQSAHEHKHHHQHERGKCHEHKHEHKHKHEHEHEHEHEHRHDHEHEHGPGTCLFHDHDDDESEKLARAQPKWMNGLLAGTGMFGLTASADLIVRSGVTFADKFNLSSLGANFDLGLSQAVIGAVVVALGTSLPELVLNIQAIKKNHSELAVGNVLGCSIINTLVAGGVIGLTGAAVPEAFNPSTSTGMLNTGMFMGSAGLIAATLFANKGGMKRWHGGAALGLYAAYLAGSMALNDGTEPKMHQHAPTQKIEIAADAATKPIQTVTIR